jgi:hypothetical protein
MRNETDDEKKIDDVFSILTNAFTIMPNGTIERGRRFLL